MQQFKALQVDKIGDEHFERKIVTRPIDDLPAGEVLVRVHYSSLNYKDALSASGNRGVTKKFPHTPGIDAAGHVEASTHPDFSRDTKVIVSCYDLGMNTSGGFGEYIRVPAAWVMPCPEQLSLKESMIYGTGGFTAAMSVSKLMEQGVRPGKRPVLVTGATGGVGSMAVALLAREGFTITAVSGKADQVSFLQSIGANRVISREEASDPKNRTLLKERWAGVIDTVGGELLATAIKSTRYGGTVTCCGNAASPDLLLTVYPFILRGVSLLGIDAAECPMEYRQKIWHKLATNWKLDNLDSLATFVGLEHLDEKITAMLQKKITGRIVLQHAGVE